MTAPDLATLRRLAHLLRWPNGEPPWRATCEEAAALMEALAAENAALKLDMNEANVRAAVHSVKADRLAHALDAAQAEARRYREALQMARLWGISSVAFHADQSDLLAVWVADGMQGDLPVAESPMVRASQAALAAGGAA